MSTSTADCDPTVYIVGDDPATVREIADLVRSCGVIARTYESPLELFSDLDCAAADQVGCVVIHWLQPDIDGLELHQQLVTRRSPMPTIIVTVNPETALVVRAMRSGILAVLESPVRENELWSFIQEAIARSVQECRRRDYQSSLESRFRALSPTDRQVLQLILEGCKNRTMARRLNVSLRTVENRRRRVFDALHAESVAELTRMVMAYEHNLMPSSSGFCNWQTLPFERVN